ncbi:soluble lytic murein transglycosylase-like protein [Virgibacillus halotolerans]|uniref:transglycosylase SLT domain-containing protein n=1 Tax=Virgibacillus halotolerans TaxID=1071053 RepID=UPI00195FC995|nr:transglycosylase SLT domain-containing protein [Virgibacillus halotolerans]MBM7598079.1 soluble lytic murein transglycosylase-like protein [Virgibacillus halotolerans]
MNSLKTLYTRITTLDEAVASLDSVGVSTKDAAGGMRDVDDILGDLAGKWDSLNAEQQQNIGVNVAGRFQVSRFLTLMQQYDTALDVTETSLHSQGSAMREQSEYAKSLEARYNRLSNAGVELSRSMGDAVLTNGIVSVTEGIARLTSSADGLVKSVGVMAPVMGVAGLATVGLSTKVRTLATALIFGTGEMKRSQLATVGLSQSMDRAAVKTVVFKNALRGLATATVVGAAFMAAGFALEKLINLLGESIQKKEELREQNETSVNSIRNEKENIDELVDSYEKLSNVERDNEQEEEYARLQNEIASLLPGIKTGENAKGEAIIASSEAVREHVGLLEKQIELEQSQLRSEAPSTLEDNNKDLEKYRQQMEDEEKDLEKWTKLANDAADKLAASRDGTGDKLKAREESGLENDIERWNRYATDASNASIEASNSMYEIQESTNQTISAIISDFDDLSSVDVGTIANIVNEEGISSIDEIDKLAERIVDLKSELGDGFTIENLDLSQIELVESKMKDISNISPDDDAHWEKLSDEFRKAGIEGSNLATLMGGLRYEQHDIANAFALSADAVAGQVPKFDEVGNIVDWVTEQFIDNEEAVEDSKTAMEELMDTYNEATGSISELNGIIDELNEGNGLTADSIGIILEKYPELLGYLDNEKVLKQKLEEATISEGKTATDVLRKKLENDEHFLKESMSGYKQLYNFLNDSYDIDLGNFNTLAAAKAKVEGNLINELAGAWSKYLQVTGEGLVDLNVQAQELMAEVSDDPIRRVVEMPILRTGLLGNRNQINTELEKVNAEFNKVTDQALNIDSNGIAMNLDKVGSSAEKNAGKAGNAAKKAGEKAKKSGEDVNEMTKEYESAIYAAEKFKLALEELNLQLEKQRSIQSKYPEYSKQYRNALEKEIKLLKEKRGLTQKQASELEKQIKNGTIVPTGVLSSVASTSKTTTAASSSKGQYSGKYAKEINASAKRHGVDPFLVAAIIQQESNWNPKARSGAGAQGLMQLMPGTARGLGVKNSYNPAQNIEGGTKYIAQQLKSFGGDITKALAAYNAGPGNVRKYGGVPPFKETQNYVKIVQKNLKSFGKALTFTEKTVNSSSKSMNKAANYYLDNFKITSPYGERTHPVTGKKGKMHHGVDFANGKAGDPVKALRAGKVTTAGYSTTAGNWVVVQQDDGTVAKYMHMLSDLKVKKGQNVSANQQIGRVGSTGSSTGNHIHIGIERNGKSIDPMDYIQDLSKTAAQGQQDVDGAKSELAGLKGDITEINDQIEELYFAIVESHLAAYDHSKEKLEKGLAQVDYYQSRYSEDSNAWAKQQLKREKLMKDQTKYQKDSIKFLEREIKANKNLTKAQKMHLNDELRDRQIELWNMERAVLEERISMAEKLTSVYKDALQAQKDAALDSVDKLLKEIDDKEKEADYKKKLRDEQKNRQEIEDEISKLSMNDSGAARKKIKELTEELQKLDESIDDMQHEKGMDDRKDALGKEKEKIETKYDNLINDEKAFADMRSQIIDGNTKSIKNKLDSFYKQLGSMTDALGKSTVNNLKRSISQMNAYMGGKNFTGMKVPSFDTGGMTSVKKNSGGIAVVHDKEIILNKDDTSNFLKAIDMTRSMVNSIGKVKSPPLSSTEVKEGGDTIVHVNIENTTGSRKETEMNWKNIVKGVKLKGGKI